MQPRFLSPARRVSVRSEAVEPLVRGPNAAEILQLPGARAIDEFREFRGPNQFVADDPLAQWIRPDLGLAQLPRSRGLNL
jgi:hypothetical protein